MPNIAAWDCILDGGYVILVDQALDLLKNNNVCVIANEADVFALLLSKVSKSARYSSETAESRPIIKHNLYR